MTKYWNLERRLDRFRAGPKYEDDGFAAACGALPGETGLDALRRQAAGDWSDYPRGMGG